MNKLLEKFTLFALV